MHVGMLWFDNTPNITLKTKIEKAINHYRHKYHREPNLCLINPKMMGDEHPQIDSMTIRPYRPVLPGHLWIGIEDNN
jgi:hypothetical protein